MARWVAIWALSGCNLAVNAVRPSSDRFPDDSGAPTTGTTPTEATDVLISEVMAAVGDVKFVELYNGTEDTIDLKDYELVRYANGREDVAERLLLDGHEVEAGSTFVISGRAANFSAAFGGLVPDLPGESQLQGDGNDTYVLAYESGGAEEVVDIYGVLGVDGIGEDWEYTDATAKRRPVVVAGRLEFKRSEWIIEDWDIADPDVATPGER